MKLLSELSRMSHAAVVCTIHQPSASVYERIDTLLLLTKGRTAYYGKAGGLMEYLASLGKPVPAGTSVSELALDLVNADFTSDADVDAIVHAWHKQALPPPSTALTSALPTVPERAPHGRLYATLIEKIARTNLADTSYLQGRLLLYFFLGAIYSIYFVKVRDRKQENVTQIFYLINFTGNNLFFLALATLNSAASRWPNYQREIKSDMYGPIAYWTVSTLLSIVVSFVLVLFATPFLYAVCDFPAASWPKVTMIFWMGALFLDATAEFASFAGQEGGTALQSMVTLHSMYSNGAFLNPLNIIWPFRVFTYILPGRFIFSSFLTVVFLDSDNFSGAMRLSEAPLEVRNSSAGLAAAKAGREFVCNDAGESNVCYAASGYDILSELNVRTHRMTAMPPALPSPLLASPSP